FAARFHMTLIIVSERDKVKSSQRFARMLSTSKRRGNPAKSRAGADIGPTLRNHWQSSDNQPTQQSYMVYEDLATRVNAELKKLEALTGPELMAFNKMIRDENVPAVQAPAKKTGQ